MGENRYATGMLVAGAAGADRSGRAFRFHEQVLQAARSGSVMRVRCHCQPPRLVTLNPCSIHARSPYQPASATSGGKSVRSSHTSAQPALRHASRVQRRRLGLPWKAVPVPCHRLSDVGATVPRRYDPISALLLVPRKFAKEK